MGYILMWLLFGCVALSTNSFGEKPRPIILRTEEITLDIKRSPFQLILSDDSGKRISETIPHMADDEISWGVYTDQGWDPIVNVTSIQEGERFSVEAATRSERPVRIVIESVNESVLKVTVSVPQSKDVQSIGLTLFSGLDEKYRGMGQRFNGLELRGQEIPTNDQEFTVPLPFYVSSNGYGIYIETNGMFTVDFCTRNDSTLVFWAEGDSLTYYWMYGPEPAEISKQYTEMTGRMMLPPEWAFGMWKWRDWAWDEKEVYEDATMLQSLDIPASVIFIDSPWSNEYIDYEFNPKQFPDPKRMISDLHEMGYKVLLWIVPFITPYADNYPEAERNDYFVKTPEGDVYQVRWWRPTGTFEMGLHSDRTGGMIDFTNPDAVKWWQGQVKKVVDLGLDGFKMDDGEHLPNDAKMHNGKIGRQVKNYPLLYYKAVYDLMEQERPGDYVIKARAGWPGSQRYVPVHWGADQNADWDMDRGLPSVIRGGQSMAICGFPYWGSDVGGYRWGPHKELFIRWTQFGAFCPIMEVGGKSYHEPWMFDSETVSIFRRYAQLHAHMFPYLWHYANVAVQEGDPMIRPLFWHFPEDSNAWEEEFEYMLGEELLVAPLYRPGNIRSVYIPQGEWMDFWSGEILSGPLYIDSYLTQLSQIPLFLSVKQTTSELLLGPLLNQQLTDFESRVDYFTWGLKKFILRPPIERLLKQMDIFRESFPRTYGPCTIEELLQLEEGVSTFSMYLQGEYQRGHFPDHVHETLSQRLEMVELNIMLHKKLFKVLD